MVLHIMDVCLKLNVLFRVINGIIPDNYEVQMQIQLEVCDLEVCDFCEIRICSYDH